MYTFQVTQTQISKSGKAYEEESDADLLMETILETINVSWMLIYLTLYEISFKSMLLMEYDIIVFLCVCSTFLFYFGLKVKFVYRCIVSVNYDWHFDILYNHRYKK